jgi:hypothetical protein
MMKKKPPSIRPHRNSKIFRQNRHDFGRICRRGLLVIKGVLNSLDIAISLQILSCLLMTQQAYVGYPFPQLIFVMGSENFASGIATTVLVAYIATRCRPPFTATQYAF